MCQSEFPDPTAGLSSPDPLVREAYLMAHDYIDYVTCGGADGDTGPAPTACTAALRHAGDELLTRFPIFFRRWPRVFKDVTEETAIPTLMSILDQHFFPPDAGGRRRDLAWSAVLSVYVLAGQMALHCHESGLEAVLPRLKESTGAYVERVVCPEIRSKGGWVRKKRTGSLQIKDKEWLRISLWEEVWTGEQTEDSVLLDTVSFSH